MFICLEKDVATCQQWLMIDFFTFVSIWIFQFLYNNHKMGSNIFMKPKQCVHFFYLKGNGSRVPRWLSR